MGSQICLITSGKGGAGKSSACVLLGAAIAKQGKRVLLIELDSGLRGLDVMLGLAAQVVYDLDDVLHKRCAPAKAVLAHSSLSSLHLLAAPAQPVQWVQAPPLLHIIQGFAPYYDYILLDSPAGLHQGFLLGANACTCALVVATPDPICVRDAYLAGRVLRDHGVNNLALIINRLPARFTGFDTLPDLDAVIDQTEIQLLGVIPEDPRLSAALAKGQSAQVTGPVAQAYANVAARLAGEERELLIQ